MGPYAAPTKAFPPESQVDELMGMQIGETLDWRPGGLHRDVPRGPNFIDVCRSCRRCSDHLRRDFEKAGDEDESPGYLASGDVFPVSRSHVTRIVLESGMALRLSLAVNQIWTVYSRRSRRKCASNG